MVTYDSFYLGNADVSITMEFDSVIDHPTVRNFLVIKNCQVFLIILFQIGKNFRCTIQ